MSDTPTSSSKQSPTQPQPPRRLLPGVPPRTSNAPRITQAGGSDPDSDGAAPAGQLVIGRSVRFRGTIDDTRRVVVHGRANATLPSGSLEVAEGGMFTGRVDVESATIAGTFDGTLMVSGRLTVAATGIVTGTVRYAELAVEAGGELSGDVARDSPPEQRVAKAEADPEPAEAEPGHPPVAEAVAECDRTPELV